jgi:hypothetical protein
MEVRSAHFLFATWTWGHLSEGRSMCLFWFSTRSRSRNRPFLFFEICFLHEIPLGILPSLSMFGIWCGITSHASWAPRQRGITGTCLVGSRRQRTNSQRPIAGNCFSVWTLQRSGNSDITQVLAWVCFVHWRCLSSLRHHRKRGGTWCLSRLNPTWVACLWRNCWSCRVTNSDSEY